MRRVLLTLFAAILAVLLGTGWYVYNRGFTKKWRGMVTEEFRKRGVEVSIRKLSLDPLRGLVAQNVKVLDTRNRKRVLAEVDEIILQVNYANLMRGQTFLDALDLRDANLALPLDASDPQSERVEVSKLNARLFLPPQQIYLARAEAEVFGIQVSMTGRLINPQTFRPKPSSGDGAKKESVNVGARIIEELKALKFEAAPPVLNIAFSGDLATPDKLFVDVSLWGEGIRRGTYLLKNIYLSGSYRDGVADLKQLRATDATGALLVQGAYRFSAREAEMRLQSTLDVQALARAFRFAPLLQEFVFYDPPALDVTARGTLGDTPSFEAIGHASLRKFAFKSVVFESLAADFSSDGSRWSARDVKLVHRSGELTGDAMQVPGRFRCELRSSLNPKPLAPLLSGNASQALSLFEFRESPVLSAALNGPDTLPETLSIAGELQLRQASYRGAACESLTTQFNYLDRKLALSPFRLVRTEGVSTGGLMFDFKRDEVRLDKIKATVIPSEVAQWMHPDVVKNVLPYRFKRAPNLVIDGIVHTKGGKSTKFTVDVDAPGGMDYTFLGKNLSSPKVAAKLLFTWDKLKIDDFNASLFGGRMEGTAEISLLRDKPGHKVKLELDNVDFASITKLYFGYDDSQGRLNARYDFTGRGDDARTMEGRGELTVTDGNVFAIPFLGPLSGILNTIVPGMGYNTARKGSATFTIDEGVIDTKDVVVEGKGFSMIGHGKLFFLDDKMDFDMRINAQGLPGVLLFPVSKLLEYTSTDKLSKPTWRPKVVPRL